MKFIIDNMWLLATALLSGGALLWPILSGARGNKVSLLQATQLINQGKAIVLDVRESAEFAAGHLRESRNIPLSELAKRVGELDRFKSKSVIVVCASGTRASRAESVLKKAGFAEVFGLQGGLTAWRAQGLPVTR